MQALLPIAHPMPDAVSPGRAFGTPAAQKNIFVSRTRRGIAIGFSFVVLPDACAGNRRLILC